MPHLLGSCPPEVAVAARKALPGAESRAPLSCPLFTAEDVSNAGPAAMNGADIWVGISATESNNHAEALALLRHRVGDGRLVVPLSYGSASYGAKVVALGHELFGSRFEPLQQWMSLDAYNERIGRCGVVVMNHCRQQAVGNIGSALFKGATVYLRRENPLFGFYAGLGIVLRPVDALAEGCGPIEPLTPAERTRNRALIAQHYGRERVLQAMRELPALRG